MFSAIVRHMGRAQGKQNAFVFAKETLDFEQCIAESFLRCMLHLQNNTFRKTSERNGIIISTYPSHLVLVKEEIQLESVVCPRTELHLAFLTVEREVVYVDGTR